MSLYRCFTRSNARTRSSLLSSVRRGMSTSVEEGGLINSDYEVWVGLETHAQIQSNTKLFSNAAISFQATPNSCAALFDASIPGTLPRINEHCVHQAIKLGSALGGRVNKESHFDRKHYFYCDMPLGYQMTQQTDPIVTGGEMTLDSLLSEGHTRTVGIQRIQLEQDSGKSLHDVCVGMSHIDLNRAGSALLEIVTEPHLQGAEESVVFLRKLQNQLRHLGVGTGNLEDGSMRCDVNVTVKKKNGGKMTERVEIKNMNSFKFIHRAIMFEANRQIELCEKNEPVLRETRRYDPKSGITFKLRSKEDQLDYRFYPEPDLPPLVISDDMVKQVLATMPVQPEELYTKFTQELKLDKKSANILLQEQGASDYFLTLVAHTTQGTPQHCYNWLCSELFGQLRKTREATHGEDSRQLPLLHDISITPQQLASLVDLVVGGDISGKQGKELLELVLTTQEDPEDIARAQKMVVDRDTDRLSVYCDTILQLYPTEVDNYLNKNRTNMLGFFCGQAIKYSKQQKEQGKAPGDAHPTVVNTIMKQKLDDMKSK